MCGARAYDRISGQLLGRFVNRLIIGKYKPRIDRCLGFGTAFKQATLDEQAVGALAGRSHAALLLKLQKFGSGTMVHVQRLAVLGRKCWSATMG
jgi:hypothetical protein